MKVCKVQAHSSASRIQTLLGDSSTLQLIVGDTLNDTVDRIGNGILFHHSGVNYVLTCHHITLNNFDTCKCYISGTIYNAVSFLQIEHYDVNILRIEDLRELVGLDLEQYCDLKQDSYPECESSKIITHNKTIKVSEHSYSSDAIRSNLFPMMPIVNVDIDKRTKMEGLSGALVEESNEPLGMIVCTSENEPLKCVYLSFLLRLIGSMIKLKVKDINGIYIDTLPCEIEWNDEDFNVSYVTGSTRCYLEANHKKDFKLDRDDIIFSVNNEHPDGDGNFNCKKLLKIDINVSLNTYLLILGTLYNRINMKVIKSDNTSKILDTILIPTEYNKIFSNTFLDTERRMVWNGFVFCELSEELLMSYSGPKIKVSQKITDSIREKYIDHRNIILLKVQKNNVATKYKHISLPLVEGNTYHLLKVDKVGQKRPKNLMDLYKILNTYKSSTATFFFDILGANETLKMVI